MKSARIFTFIMLLVMLAGPAAASPRLINYQGRLTNNSGRPVTTAVDITFTFWDAPTGGNQLGVGFVDTDTITPDAQGLYTTLIGDDPNNLVPESVFTGDSVWLNIAVAGENLAPRRQITSVAFAFQSNHAAAADSATTAAHALTAAQSAAATHAIHATQAETATLATRATAADTATSAATAAFATQATTATTAIHAQTASQAATADSASNAAHAALADMATSATTAEAAHFATQASTADTATTAGVANEANHAAHAGVADFATTASAALKADLLDGLHSAAFATTSSLAAFAPRPSGAIYRWAVFNTLDYNTGWFGNNEANLFGGVYPNAWAGGTATAANISSNKELLRTLFTHKGYGGKNALVWAEEWMTYSYQNTKHALALFRIRNTTPNPINWTVCAYQGAYGFWMERASVALNGVNIWTSGNNVYGANSVFYHTLPIPPNRVSTVIFVSASGPPVNVSAGIYQRSCFLAFGNDSLQLPAGLQYVDDLDTATGDWSQ